MSTNYDTLDEYAEALEGDVPAEDVNGVLARLDGKVDHLSELDPDALEVEENSDGSYSIEVEGYGTFNYSPEGQRDANNNVVVGETPPEMGGDR